MKNLIICLVVVLSGAVSGQSIVRPCEKSGDYYYQQNFELSFSRDASGLWFGSNEPCLTPELKTGLKRFFRETNYREYSRMGDYTVHIVKKEGRYYIVQKESPLNLVRL